MMATVRTLKRRPYGRTWRRFLDPVMCGNAQRAEGFSDSYDYRKAGNEPPT